MFCPECASEYYEGYTTCADCGATLVEKPPPERRFAKLVPVLTTSDHALAIVAKSVLDGAGIPFCTFGERAQDLFGMGRLGPGFNVAVGPLRILVPEDYEEEARALLKRHGRASRRR